MGPAGSGGGDCAIEGENDELGFDRLPRSSPRLYKVTLVGSAANGPPTVGMLVGKGSGITAKNVVVTGFAASSIDVWDSSPSLFIDETRSMHGVILHANGGRGAAEQVDGGSGAVAGQIEAEPMLVNMRYEANPDPRPLLGPPLSRSVRACRRRPTVSWTPARRALVRLASRTGSRNGNFPLRLRLLSGVSG